VTGNEYGVESPVIRRTRRPRYRGLPLASSPYFICNSLSIYRGLASLALQESSAKIVDDIVATKVAAVDDKKRDREDWDSDLTLQGIKLRRRKRQKKRSMIV
jgi:hypothetical protein